MLAQVRRDGTDGVLFDAVENPRFRAMLLEGILAGETLLGRAGSLICTAGIATFEVPTGEPIESTVSTNSRGETYIDFGRDFVIKLFRQVEPGVNPDLELRRFLTERTAFDDIADTYGALEYQSGDTYTLGVLQQSFAEDSTTWNVLSGFARNWLDATETRRHSGSPTAHSDRWIRLPSSLFRMPTCSTQRSNSRHGSAERPPPFIRRWARSARTRT